MLQQNVIQCMVYGARDIMSKASKEGVFVDLLGVYVELMRCMGNQWSLIRINGGGVY